MLGLSTSDMAGCAVNALYYITGMSITSTVVILLVLVV